MIKILSLLFPSLSMVVSGVISVGSYNHEQQRSNVRSHIVEYENYEVTYKYESNEVNSVDDLIVGNIYNLNVNGYLTELVTDSSYEMSIRIIEGEIVLQNLHDDFVDFDDYIISDNVLFHFDDTLNYQLYVGDVTINGILENNEVIFANNCKVILYDFYNVNYEYFSKCENIPIESVEPISYNTSVLGYIYDFIYNDILTIPHIDDFTYNVMGQTISLHRYLAITICIVFACLLIFLLVWFIRYLFRLFSGLLH